MNLLFFIAFINQHPEVKTNFYFQIEQKNKFYLQSLHSVGNRQSAFGIKNVNLVDGNL